jgi:hypothetical protein
MPMPRHGVAGAVIGVAPGERDDPVRGAMSFLDRNEVHTGTHDVLEPVQSDPPTGAKTEGTTSAAAPKKAYTRYNVNSPEAR